MAPRTLIAAASSALLVLAALLTGCSGVFVSQPVGEPVDADTTRAFAGVWALSGLDSGNDMIYFVKALDDGRLRLGWVEDDGDNFKVKQTIVVITRHGEACLLNLQDPDPDKHEWSFFRLTCTPENPAYAVLVVPTADVFVQAVKAGELAGNVETGQGTTVHLTADESTLRAFLDPAKVGEQFELDAPIVLRRLVKHKE